MTVRLIRSLPMIIAFCMAFVAASEVMAWLLLAAACLLVPRTWQEKAARLETAKSPWRTWWRLGGQRRREYLRTVVLGENPLKWLACRERWCDCRDDRGVR